MLIKDNHNISSSLRSNFQAKDSKHGSRTAGLVFKLYTVTLIVSRHRPRTKMMQDIYVVVKAIRVKFLFFIFF